MREIPEKAVRDYRELMADLAHMEPRHGYSASDLTLTNDQLAAVVRRRDDLVPDAVVGLEEQIAGVLEAMERRPNHHGLLLAGLGAKLLECIRKEAPGKIIEDVWDACEERAKANATDDRFARETA